MARDRVDRLDELLGGREVPVFVADQDVVDAIVGFPLHRGVVAVAERALPVMATTIIRRARRLVVLEGINDAENLGALLRSARAFGADGVLVDPTSADPLSRRAVRVSMGHALELDIAAFTWDEHRATLAGAGFTLIAMTPSPDAVAIDDVSLPADARVAVALGAEGPGLSAEALEASDVRVRIALADGVDSLNVAAAGAVAMHRLFGRA